MHRSIKSILDFDIRKSLATDGDRGARMDIRKTSGDWRAFQMKDQGGYIPSEKHVVR
jgi:hypothetical protein